MTDRIAELRSESRDLLALLQRLGDGEHDDLSVAHDALAEIINLRLQRAALFDCAEALQAVLEILPVCPQGTGIVGIEARYNFAVVGAREALARLNGDDHD